MPKAITRYACDVCGAKYDHEESARLCESFGVVEWPVPIGTRLLFKTRDGDEEEAAVVGYENDSHPYLWHADSWDEDRRGEFVATVERLLASDKKPDRVHRLSFVVDEDLWLDHKWESPHRSIDVTICYGWRVKPESPQAAGAVDPVNRGSNEQT